MKTKRITTTTIVGGELKIYISLRIKKKTIVVIITTIRDEYKKNDY